MTNRDTSAPSETVSLRNVVAADLPTLFAHEQDPDSYRMAVVNPREWESFQAHWDRAFGDESATAKAILLGGQLVGRIGCFCVGEKDFVGYWIAKEHWGKGIATRALALLLDEVSIRPLWARVARSNIASIRVLEHSGFAISHYEDWPGDERYPACEEAMLVLS